jgi:tRNA(Arg) A34 adenosine deaminase TadA
MSEQHQKFMAEAISLSMESVKSGGGPFGAVVVKDGEIVGRGFNRVTVWNDPTAHGEVVAIRDACNNLNSFQLENCVIYTSAEPCPMCLGAIYWARPQAVYYGNSKQDAAKIGFDDDFIYEEIALPYEKRRIAFYQIMREEALLAFQKWSEKAYKTEY